MTCLLTSPPPALTHFPLSGAHTSRLSGLCTGLVSCFYLSITAKMADERGREREKIEARIERDCSTLLQCSSIYSICSLLNGSPPSRTHTFSAGLMLVNAVPASGRGRKHSGCTMSRSLSLHVETTYDDGVSLVHLSTWEVLLST